MGSIIFRYRYASSRASSRQRTHENRVAHLQGLDGTDTEVTIEISATNASGFPDNVVKIVAENASALRFREQGFEET